MKEHKSGNLTADFSKKNHLRHRNE